MRHKKRWNIKWAQQPDFNYYNSSSSFVAFCEGISELTKHNHCLRTFLEHNFIAIIVDPYLCFDILIANHGSRQLLALPLFSLEL